MFLNLVFHGKCQLEVIVCVFLVWGTIIGGSFSGLRSSWWGVLLFSFPVVFPLDFVCGTVVVSWSPYKNVGIGREVSHSEFGF